MFIVVRPKPFLTKLMDKDKQEETNGDSDRQKALLKLPCKSKTVKCLLG